MKKRILVSVALVAVLVAGGLMASNMGFKLAYQMDELDTVTFPASSGQNTLALPYNQQTSLVTAADLATDINAVGAVFPCVQGVDCAVNTVSTLNRVLDTLVTYPPNAFTLEPGKGLLVAMTANSGVPIDYVAVGSHAPGLVVDLLGQLDPNSNSGTNFFSYPYHAVAGTASALEAEIELLAAGAVQTVSKLNRTNDTLQSYPPADFALEPGKFYYIGLTAAAPNIPYVPAHY